MFLKDIWPSAQEIDDTIKSSINQDMFRNSYATIFEGDDALAEPPTPEGDTFAWDENSTYVRKPPYFDGMTMETAPVSDIKGARVLALLGDSVTTDHISPAGSDQGRHPGGAVPRFARRRAQGLQLLGSRRGNHEVMIRGTFANIRSRTSCSTTSPVATPATSPRTAEPRAFIYDASQNYKKAGIPLVVIGGKEYGSGTSRDWAAKGTTCSA